MWDALQPITSKSAFASGYHLTSASNTCQITEPSFLKQALWTTGLEASSQKPRWPGQVWRQDHYYTEDYKNQFTWWIKHN